MNNRHSFATVFISTSVEEVFTLPRFLSVESARALRSEQRNDRERDREKEVERNEFLDLSGFHG